MGFLLDVGKSVKPFITPDDPDAFEMALRSLTDLPPASSPPGRAPLV